MGACMDMNKNLHQMWQDRERLWSVTNTYCHLSLSRHRRKRLNKDSEGKLREHTDVPLWLLRQSKSLQCAEKWYLDEVRQQTKHLTGTGIQVRPFFFYQSLLRQFVMCVYSGIQVRYFCPLLCQEVYISIYSCVQAPPVVEWERDALIGCLAFMKRGIILFRYIILWRVLHSYCYSSAQVRTWNWWTRRKRKICETVSFPGVHPQYIH